MQEKINYKKAIITGIIGSIIIAIPMTAFIFLKSNAVNAFYEYYTSRSLYWGGDIYRIHKKIKLTYTYNTDADELKANNTPEEIYSQFRKSMSKDKYEEALTLISKENQNKYREFFKNSLRLSYLKDLPEASAITRDANYGNLLIYTYLKGYDMPAVHTIEFVLNRKENKWEIAEVN